MRAWSDLIGVVDPSTTPNPTFVPLHSVQRRLHRRDLPRRSHRRPV